MDFAEVVRLTESAQRVLRQVDSVGRQWQASAAQTVHRHEASLERFRTATAGLDRHQYAEANHLLDSWAATQEQAQPWALWSPIFDIVEWIRNRRRPDQFALELRRAHEHPAAFRKSWAAGRFWFEDWREALFAALSAGIGLDQLRSEARGISPPSRRGVVVRAPRQDAPRRPLAERLRHSIFTHGPTPGASPIYPVIGDGLKAPIG
jgi:hypothetical protein